MKKPGNKSTTLKPGVGIMGGKTKMSGKNNAGPQVPVSSSAAGATAGGAKKAAPFIKGGNGKMAGFTGTKPVKAK